MVNIQKFKKHLPVIDCKTRTPFYNEFELLTQKIEGMTRPGIMHLLNLAVQCLEGDEIYCEVGVYNGLSLIAALLSNNAKAYAVDNFSRVPGYCTKETLELSLKRAGMTDRVTIFEMDYRDFFDQLEDVSIGVYFYDAAHAYEHQRRGLELVVPFLSNKALLFVDDIIDIDNVQKANNEFKLKYKCKSMGVLCEEEHEVWHQGLEIILWDKHKLMPYEERIKKYTEEYFFKKNLNESADYKIGRLRKDMFCALRYIYGYTNYLSMSGQGNSFQTQLKNIKKGQTRLPKLILSIGSGRGDIEAVLTYDGVKCILSDPSPHTPAMIKRTMKEWAGTDDYLFYNDRLIDVVKKVDQLTEKPDTILMCETLEHITKKEFTEAFEIFKHWHPLLVIVNYLEMHPIERTDEWNHIRSITDEDYDELCKQARRVVFRKRSHLVLQL